MPEPSPSAIKDQLAGIARNGSFNMIGAVAGALLNFALIVVVAQTFDQSAAGMLFSATSVFLILLAAATLGTETGLSRFILRFKAMGRSADVRGTVRIAAIPVALVSISLAVGTVILAPWISPLIGLAQGTGVAIIVVLASLLPLAAAGNFALFGARAFGTVRSTVLVDKLFRPGLQPLAALVTALAGGGALWLVASWSIPYAIAAIMAIVMFHRLFEKRLLTIDARQVTPQNELRREFWTFTWPRGIARICQILLQRADIVIIAAILGVREAAIYTAATRFVTLGQFGVQAIQQVLQPRFSQMLARDQRREVAIIFKISTAWNMAVAWPLYLIAFFASSYYLLLFGSDYMGQDAKAVVMIMSAAMLIAVAAGPLDTMLLMAGGSMTSLWIGIIALIINILLCLTLVPTFGILGAAIAWGIAVVMRNGLTYLCVRSSLSITPFSKAAGLTALATVLGFGAPMLPLALTSGTNLWALAALLIFGSTIYLVLLWLWRRPLHLSTFRSLRRGHGLSSVTGSAPEPEEGPGGQTQINSKPPERKQ